MPAGIRKLYAPEYLVRDAQKLGPIPSTAEAYRDALHIAWPATMETVLVALVSLVDTMMVSGIGHEAVAAVGICTQPKFIMLMLVTVLNMSVVSIVARRKGEGDAAGAISCLKQSLILSAGLAILTTIIGIVWARPLLLFSGAQPDTIDMAQEYFSILMIGQFFTCISLTVTSAMRGCGDTKISMRINLTANFVNIVFNWLLIGGHLGFPALGVAGAAIATVLGFIAGFGLAVAALLRKQNFVNIVSGGSWRFYRDTLHSMYVVCSGSFFEQLAMRIGFLMYSKTVASLGTMVFATHQICMNISHISFAFGEGLGIAASSLVGQYLGARREDLSIMYGNLLQRMSLCVASVMCLVFIFGGHGLMMIFSDVPQIIEMGANVLIMIGIITVAQNSQMIYLGSLRGAGDTRYTAVLSLISITLLRPVLAYLLCYPAGWGIYGAWTAFMCDQFIRLTFTYLRFVSGKWAKMKL